MPTSRVLGFQGLSNLPSEIVCLVLANTSVPDILHVRATCRRLQRVSRERIVWIEALRNLCAEMELLVPSFPMERMSPEQLEYAASCHVRFRGLSKAFFSHPGHEQIPLSGIVRTINWPTPFRALHIIPGGRYLITMTETTLQLWDLGFGFHIPDFASLQPVASMECNVLEDSTIWIGSFPGLNGSVTIELTDEMPADNGGVSLTLFHVSNLESNPKFVEVGHFETPHATYFATSPNGLPTVFFEANTNFMGIWDVKANMGARWKSDEPAALVNTTGGNVLQINRDRLAMDIFDFPRQLFPIEANSLPETIIHDPLFSIEWGKELLRHGEVTAIRLANEWISSICHPQRFELICRHGNGEVSVTRKVTKPIRFADQSSDSQNKCLPITVHSAKYDDLKLGEVDCPNSIAFPDHWRMLWWSSVTLPLAEDDDDAQEPPQPLRIHLSDIRPGQEQDRKPRSHCGVLWDDLPMLNQWTFCPTTARLCLVEDDVLKVVDFLKWPHQ